MMKKSLAIGICILILFCFVSSAAEEYTDEPYLGTVSYAGYALVHDAEAKIWYLSVSQNGKMREIELSSIKAYGAKIVLSQERVTSEEIKQNVSVSIEFHSNGLIYTEMLRVTTLPLALLTVEEEIGDKYVKMILNVDGVSSEGLIRIRGVTSRTFPKKSYRISLKRDAGEKNKIAFLNMRRDDDWILYPAYNDQEKIRNVICTKLWYDMNQNSKGVRNANEFEYVELFINNRYWGVYALGSPLDNKEMILSNAENAVIFKKTGWVDEVESITMDDEGPIAGYKIYKASGRYSEDNPDECWKLLADYYRYLSEKHDDSKELLRCIDIENQIDIALFLNFIQGQDNASGNFIKNEIICLTDYGNRIMSLYAPWDMDLTLGNKFSNESKNFTSVYEIKPSENMLFEQGYYGQILWNGDTELVAQTIKRYRNLRSTVWSEDKINLILDKYEQQIYGSGAYFREMERWPEGTYGDSEKGLERFRAYFHERLENCDAYYERLSNSQNLSPLMQRTLAYDDFLSCNFLIELGDNSKLEVFKELFDYMGIDVSTDANYIICCPAKQQYQYLESLGSEEDGIETVCGQISFEPYNEVYYWVLLDEVPLYTTNGEVSDLKIMMEKDAAVYQFNTMTDFVLQEYR